MKKPSQLKKLFAKGTFLFLLFIAVRPVSAQITHIIDNRYACDIHVNWVAKESGTCNICDSGSLTVAAGTSATITITMCKTGLTLLCDLEEEIDMIDSTPILPTIQTNCTGGNNASGMGVGSCTGLPVSVTAGFGITTVQ